MASVQVDGPEVEEVNSHVEDKTVKAAVPPQKIEEEEHHEYVEEEEDPEDLDKVTPEPEPEPEPDHENEEKLEDEDELLMGSQIVDEGEKPTGGIEFSEEEDEDA